MDQNTNAWIRLQLQGSDYKCRDLDFLGGRLDHRWDKCIKFESDLINCVAEITSEELKVIVLALEMSPLF